MRNRNDPAKPRGAGSWDHRCPTGKRRFTDAQISEGHAERRRTQGRFYNVTRVKCELCKGWHLSDERIVTDVGTMAEKNLLADQYLIKMAIIDFLADGHPPLDPVQLEDVDQWVKARYGVT